MLLGLTKQHSVPLGWDPYVASLSPDVWLKCTDVSNAAFLVSGQSGSATGFLSSNFTANMAFQSTPIMPSDLTRPTLFTNGTGYLEFSGITPALNGSTYTIYMCYKGTTGTTAMIPWRVNSAVAGDAFLQFNGTGGFLSVRVRQITTVTTIPQSSIMDGNAHLIGLAVTATNFTVWLDGVAVFTASVAGTVATLGGVFYSQNAGNSNQKPYGNYGDLVMWGRTLSTLENQNLYAAWF